MSKKQKPSQPFCLFIYEQLQEEKNTLGEKEAFKRFVEKKGGMVYKKIQNKEVVKDILTDAFMAFRKNFKPLSEAKLKEKYGETFIQNTENEKIKEIQENSCLSYITSILENKINTYLRSLYKEPKNTTLEDLPSNLEELTTYINNSELEISWYLERCLKQLKKEDEELLIKKYVHGIPYSELVEPFGAPSKEALRNKIYHIKKKLQKCLSNE